MLEAKRNGMGAFIVTLALAIICTGAVMFVALDPPAVIVHLISAVFPVSNLHPGPERDRIEPFMQAYHVRVIGYTCLGIVALLIVSGLILGKKRLAWGGAVVLFLPVLGAFGRYMFFLDGLGFLRVLWLPIWGRTMQLGNIVFLPSMVIASPLVLMKVRIGTFLGLAAITVGFLIFVAGVQVWLLARWRGRLVADARLYRISRHPQYLGWIVWSYGIMLLASGVNPVMAGQNYAAGLPWAASTLIIICVALMEERRMLRELGDDYAAYMSRTPFLLPLPRFLSRIITAPLRLLLGKDRPETRKEIALMFVIYLAITVLLSVPFYWLNFPPPTGW